MKKKKILIIILLLMVVGFATVATTLFINGNVLISGNQNDFNVYYSKTLINNVEDNSIITSDNTIVFEKTFKSVGDIYSIKYFITNGSRNYDADVTIECNNGNNYVSVNNNWIDHTIIDSNETKNGTITLEMIKGYTGDNELELLISCELEVKAIERDSLGETTPNNQLAVLKASETYFDLDNYDFYEDKSFFRSDEYLSKIKTLTFEDSINIPENAIETWDISEAENGSVMSYLITNEDDSSYYDLYIQSDEQLYANENMSWWFSGLNKLDSINGLELLDTSNVTNMSLMFYGVGAGSEVFTLDLGNNFDTSKVTNMSNMFYGVGSNSPVFTLNIGDSFDTSNVTDMSGMFTLVGLNSSVFTLDLGNNFDTSKVTNMSNMFNSVGENSSVFTLNLGNKFNTSNVTNMSGMFNRTGENDSVFTLDLGNNFNTSNVTDMSNMFSFTGEYSEVFTLDLGDLFDTSKVTNMTSMFNSAGYKSSIFTLNLGNKFNTSNVTDMTSMFEYTGRNSDSFYIDASGWNVNKVTNHIDFNRNVTTKVIEPTWVS